ncbi:MAG: glutamate racemase [Candidatus Roizmanbacteria bacterium]|nr:glutamate racemase [Candidatus Roizmanbacteria bacterium]
MNHMREQAIGVFDSGVGGLTVLKELIKTLPQEQFIYIGDTARVPYGTRSKEVIVRFARELAQFLLRKNVKCMVVACNTVSATCMQDLAQLVPVPLLGVIIPSVERIIATTKSKHVAVIGTPATIASNAYQQALQARMPEITIYAKACPLFVPITEEGLEQSDIARLTARHYLSDIPATVDTVHLGCTHYPLLTDAIKQVVGNKHIIDSAQPTAEAVRRMLEEQSLLVTRNTHTPNQLYMTDLSDRLKNIAVHFLGDADCDYQRAMI